MIITKDLRRGEQQHTQAPMWDTPGKPDRNDVVGAVVPVKGSESPVSKLITRYVDRAMLRAISTWLDEDGKWFAEVRDLPDVWASGKSQEESLEQLASVLRAWVEWKIEDKDGDIPPFDGIDLRMFS